MLGLLKDAILRDRNRERKRERNRERNRTGKKPNNRQDSNPQPLYLGTCTPSLCSFLPGVIELQPIIFWTKCLFLYLAVVEMLLQRLSQNKSTLLYVFCLAFLLFSLPRFILFPVSFIANNLIIPFSAPTTLNHSSQDQWSKGRI